MPGMKVTVDAAMRVRDVSRPRPGHDEAAQAALADWPAPARRPPPDAPKGSSAPGPVPPPRPRAERSPGPPPGPPAGSQPARDDPGQRQPGPARRRRSPRRRRGKGQPGAYQPGA
jgi:hypothetical protein